MIWVAFCGDWGRTFLDRKSWLRSTFHVTMIDCSWFQLSTELCLAFWWFRFLFVLLDTILMNVYKVILLKGATCVLQPYCDFRSWMFWLDSINFQWLRFFVIDLAFLIYISYIYFGQSKTVQTRGKKSGNEGEVTCDEEDTSTSELKQNEKHSEDPSGQPDIVSHDHVSPLVLLWVCCYVLLYEADADH